MDDFNELVRVLTMRFRDVPNVEEDDITAWAEASLIEHGIRKGARIPPQLMPLILMYAEADGATQIALKTAHFFDFTDKDEAISKGKVSENYRKISDDLWKRYRLKKDEGVEGFGGPIMRFMRRVDRP